MLSCQIVPPRNLGHRRTAQTNLAQDRSLLNIRPPTPPFSTRHNLLTHIIPIADDVVNDVNNDSELEENHVRQKAVTTGRLRFIYYNNRFHTPRGTRNEYRITWLTKFLRNANAREGDAFEISRTEGQDRYRIRVIPVSSAEHTVEDDGPVRIRLTTGWRRVH